jgi:hypothetical protein
MDRKLLEAVIHRFDGGPVGLDNVAAAIGEERDTIEDVIEPFLIQQGFLQRTPRGRVATLAAYRHLGVAPPKSTAACSPRRLSLRSLAAGEGRVGPLDQVFVRNRPYAPPSARTLRDLGHLRRCASRRRPDDEPAGALARPASCSGASA